VVLLNRGGANAGLIARRVAGLYIPDLAPRTEKPLEDREPQTAVLLRDCIARTPEWQLEQARFAPEMWKTLNEQKVEIQAQAKALGTLQSLELLSRSGSGGAHTSRYRAAFANGTVIMSLTLDRDGRITELKGSDED